MRQLIRTIFTLFLLTNSSLSPSKPCPYVSQYSELPSPWTSICSTPISDPLFPPILSSLNTSRTRLAVGQWTQMDISDSTPGSTFRTLITFDYEYYNTSMIIRSPDTSDKTRLWISSDATMSGRNSVIPLSCTLNCAPLVCAQSHRDTILTDSLSNFRSPNARGTPSPWTSSRSFPDPPDLTRSSSLSTASLSSHCSSRPSIPLPPRCLQNCSCSMYSRNTEFHHMSPPTEVRSSCPHSSAH